MEQNDFFAEMKAKTPFNPIHSVIHSVIYWKLSTDLDSYWDFSKWTPVWTNSSEGAACNLIILPDSPFLLRCIVYQLIFVTGATGGAPVKFFCPV